MDFIPQLSCFGGIFGIGHALGECGQFFPGQLALPREFKSELNHPRLFHPRQMLDLFNDTGCCHDATIPAAAAAFK